jgi:hypothetical protein
MIDIAWPSCNSGASDELLELLASGRAGAGVGMALGWLKPLAGDSLTRIAMQTDLMSQWQRERFTAFLVTHARVLTEIAVDLR